MGRGFLSGLVWGSILSVMLVWMASQMGGVIEVLKAPEDVATKAPSAVSVAPLEEEVAALTPETESPPVEPAPEAVEAESAPVDTTPVVEAESGLMPEPSEVAPLVEPDAGDPPTVIASTEEPARSPGAGLAPEAVPADVAPQIAKAVPLPEFSQPVIVEPTAPAAPAAPEEPAAALPGAEIAPEAEREAAAPVAPPADILPEPGGAPAPAPAPEPESQAEISPDLVPESQPEPKAEPTPEIPEPSELERAGTLEASGGLGGLAPNVKVNRLPTIGGSTEAVAPEAEPAPDVASGGAAITRYAAPFANPDNRPIMAIVLIDEGGERPSVADIEAFPFPLSFVVDATRSDAAEAMADFRAAGREVVALTPLPDGAAPKDVETSFETYLDRMPEVVAVMDTREAGFQSGRAVATQVAEILAAEGMGMITYSKGLNSATQVASREGVPAKLVFREFDNDGQDGAAIQRFLDNAAFRAGQGTGVILVGHDRPETIAALLEWGLGSRAASVALAPVSAVLQAD